MENEIINDDCLNVLKDIPDNSFQVSFADPPFNLNKKYKNHNDKMDEGEYLDWCKNWLQELVRVTKDDGSIFIHHIPIWLFEYSSILSKISDFKHWISWDAPTSPMGKSLQPNHYGFLYFAKNKKNNKFYEIRSPHKRDRKSGYLSKDYGGKKSSIHPFGPLLSDVWTDLHRIKHNKYRDEHPCQLPVSVLERIVLMSSDENDIIFDPFMGTGTTAIAAKRLGRKYFGIEKSKEYVQSSKRKLKMENKLSKFEDTYFSVYLNDIKTIRSADWEKIIDLYEIPDDLKEVDANKIQIKKEFKDLLKEISN